MILLSNIILLPVLIISAAVVGLSLIKFFKILFNKNEK